MQNSRDFKKAGSEKVNNVMANQIFLQIFIFVSIFWTCAFCEKTISDKLNKLNNTSLDVTGEKEMTVQVKGAEFTEVAIDLKPNKTKIGGQKEKEPVLGQTETSTNSSLIEAKTSDQLLSSISAETELEQEAEEDAAIVEPPMLAGSEEVVKSSEKEDSNEVETEIKSVSAESTESDQSSEEKQYVPIDEGVLEESFISVTPQYKMTSIMVTPPTSSFTTMFGNGRETVFISSTPRTLNSKKKVPYVKQIPSRLVAASNARIKIKQKLSTTKRPTSHKKIPTSTTKKPVRVTKPPRIKTTTEKYVRDPHHPHGVVVFDIRKKKPKPSRSTTIQTTTTTTTTTTSAPTTTSTTSEPEMDYYDYFLASGENSIEIVRNSSDNGTRIRVPLSKLALAMLESSAAFHNGTDEIYYQKTPVNLLNILQAYTKQLQVASTETYRPPVRIQSQPFMVHLNQLNFAAKVGISVYYSLIAIIPLVYLAFGGLGRLGLNAFVGRTFGVVENRKKRRKRSFDEDYYYNYYKDRDHQNNFRKGNFHANTIKRIHLQEQDNEDEYSWILGRISEVILELSQLSNEINQ